MAGVGPGWTGPPGKRLVRHITPQYMGEHHWGPFLPFPGTFPGVQGSKNGYFMAESRPNGGGGSRMDRPTWKVPGAPYHTPIHRRALLGAIFVISRHLSRGPGVQKIAIIYLPLANFFWGSERYDTISWDLIRYYTILHDILTILIVTRF